MWRCYSAWVQRVSNKSDKNCAAWIHPSDHCDPWGWLRHYIATCPAVHTALHCPTPTLSLSQFSGVFEMLRYYSEHSYHTASHYSHTWYTSWWLVSCQSPSHYINHVHTSHHAIYWQSESLELIIKMIPAFSALQTKWQEEEARDKMRVHQAASAVFWAQTPCEDHQSDSNGYLIFLYGNRFQFTANAIIDLV